MKHAYFALIHTPSTPLAPNLPLPVVGWDQIAYHEGEPVPSYPEEQGYTAILLPDMTDQLWAERISGQQRPVAVQEGRLVASVPPVSPAIPLQDQAQAQMQSVMQVAQRVGWGMFNPMPADVEAYGKALAAIADGTDTTSTTLPEVPEALAGLLGD